MLSRSSRSRVEWCAVATGAMGLTLAASAWAGSGGWVVFQNETGARLVADSALGANDLAEKDYAWGDVDHDGDLDIVCVRKQKFTTPGREKAVLFMNEGVAQGHAINGVFVDRSQQYASATNVPGDQGFMTPTNNRDVLVVDLTGDGWLDVVTATTLSDLATKVISHPRVYRNLGSVGGVWQGFRFEEERIPLLFSLPNGMPGAPRFCSVSAGDVDGDNDLDLYFTDYDQGPTPPFGIDIDDRLLINNGSGFFTDETAARMTGQMVASAFGTASAVEDMNGDGVRDIVKSTGLVPPQYVSIAYNNPANEGVYNRFQTFANLAPYHVTVGDLNQDSRLDMVISDDGADKYFLNTGNDASGMATFSQRSFSFQSGADDSFAGNSRIADLNHDGFNDVIICDVDVDEPECFSGRRMHMYRNLGDLPNVTLQEQGGEAPWSTDGAHDVVVFDMNGDGWNDMMIGRCATTEIWINQPPASLLFNYPDGLPGDFLPHSSLGFRVNVDAVAIEPTADSGRQFVSVDGGAFVETAMTRLHGNIYLATLPAVGCTSQVRFYVSAAGSNDLVYTDPPGAPGEFYSVVAAFGQELEFADDFEAPNAGWTVQNTAVTVGAWVRVDPIGTTSAGQPAQPENDYGQGADQTMCYVTGQHTGGGAGSSDLDGGPTTLTSPVFDLADVDAEVRYARWMFTNLGVADSLVTQITNNGTNWVTVEQTTSTAAAWQVRSFQVSDFVTPTATVQVRFSVSDNPNDSTTEAGIDSFSVTKLICEDADEPLLRHGLSGMSHAEFGFGGYIDPRLESSNGTALNRGLDRVTLQFNEQVFAVGGGPLAADSFTVTQTEGAAPTVLAVNTADNQTVEIVLDRIISLKEWTTVIAHVEDTAGNPIASLGNLGPGVNEPDRLDVAFLPGDIDQNSRVQPLDLLRFRQFLSGVFANPQGADADYADIDRNGAVAPLDLLRFRQLLAGTAPATQAWNGQQMNHPRP